MANSPTVTEPSLKRTRRTKASLPPVPPSITFLHDEVLVRLLAPERISHGLFIPDTAKRAAHELWRGEVLAVGPGARTPKKGIRVLPEVQVGDKVLFYWMAGLVDVTKWPDENHRIVHESHIQLILERKDANDA